MARILLGVTGGIAAYKACELFRLLVRAGHEVHAVADRRSGAIRHGQDLRCARAEELPSDDSIRTSVAGDLLVDRAADREHPRQARARSRRQRAHAGRARHGGPVLVAPAMNTRMWEHPATQENVATLRARGVELVGPAEGELAEGEEGVGRMAEPEEIHARLEAAARRDGPLCAGSACSSPRAGPVSRSTPSATSATARPAAWASRSPRRRGGAAPT